MASIFLKLLRIFRFARDNFGRILGRWVLWMAVNLGRRLSGWRCVWHAKSDTFGNLTGKPAGPSMIGNRDMGSSDSASSGTPVLKEYRDVVSASTIPASASDPSFGGFNAAPSSATPATRDSVDQPSRTPYPTHSVDGGSLASRASDRLSIITTNSRLPVGQPSQLPNAIHRQGSSPGRITEHLSRPPSPASHPHRALQPSHLEHFTTNLLSPSHGVESLAIDTTHSSPVSIAQDLPPGSPPLSPTTSPIAISDFYLPEGCFLQMIHSEQIPRYGKGITIAREQKPYDINPLTTTFPYFVETSVPDHALGRQDCNPWIPATNPDGALYFFDPERRLFTETDMHNPELKEEMEDFYLYLQNILRVGQLTIPSTNYDLVLDIEPTGDMRIQWSYYYACHDSRCLFWLDQYDGIFMTSELDGVESPAHVKHRLEALYWYHWSLFPKHFEGRGLPQYVYDELMGILTHGCIDIMTSKSSTFPFDDATMQKMIELVQKAKEATSGVEHYTAGTTRLLALFAHWRFLHFHGQQHARLIRGQSVYEKPKHERSILITLLSPLLFLGPEVHLHEMENLWTDDLIIEAVWKSFVTKQLTEWSDIILWSTVMLSVNVGFLAIPGVVLSNFNGGNLENVHQVVIFPSSSQIVSSLSIQASIGSIVIGMLLVRHIRTKQDADPAEACIYLQDHSQGMLGLEPLAIIFSLPWAFLMWSTVTFFIALLLFCSVFSNFWTRVSTSFVSLCVVACIVGCIWAVLQVNSDGKVWLDGFKPSIARALQHFSPRGFVRRVNFLILRTVGPLRDCLTSGSR